MKTSSKWTLVVIIAVLYLPFLNKAFHIDDRIYLEIADNIQVNPVFPYSFSPVFEGLVTPDAASHSHLPATAFYLSFLKMLDSAEHEWFLHLAFLVFPFLAAFSFYDLAKRFVKDPLVATGLLLASPGVLTLGHTLMPDVPLLAFWLFSLSRFMRVIEGSQRSADRIMLVVALLISAFMSLLSFGLVLLMAAFLLLMRERLPGTVSARFWVVVLLSPIALWLIWYVRGYFYYDRFLLIHTFQHMGKRETYDWSLLGVKILSFTINLGAMVLCPLALWYGFTGRFRTRIVLLCFFLVFVPFYLFFDNWQWSHMFLFALFLASGLLVWWEVAIQLTDRKPETRFLLLWFFGIFAACLLLFYAGSVRYILLGIPALILFWVRRLELNVEDSYFRRNLLWTGLVLTLLYSLPIAVADYRFAGQYRKAAAGLTARYQTEENAVWFTGEWGYRYYFEKQGAKLLLRTDNLARPGDIIIKPFVASPWVTLYDGNEYTALLEQNYVEEPFPLRILDHSSHAGFYSTGWGLLPVSWSSGEHWEWFNVFRVEKVYDGPIPEAERHF